MFYPGILSFSSTEASKLYFSAVLPLYLLKMNKEFFFCEKANVSASYQRFPSDI
jgi:hypothetical protein